MKTAGFWPAVFYCLTAVSGAAEQAGGQLAVDMNKRAESFWLRIGQNRQGLLEHEQADIGDVLADGRRQWVFLAGGRGYEDRPQLAVIMQGSAELGTPVVPAVADDL